MMTLKVNGREHQVDADPDTPLLYVLRDDIKLNAAKFGCGLGQCGACTVIVDGKASIEQVGQQFFEIILKTASGQPSKSEIFGYGEDEFAPWVLGPTM